MTAGQVQRRTPAACVSAPKARGSAAHCWVGVAECGAMKCDPRAKRMLLLAARAHANFSTGQSIPVRFDPVTWVWGRRSSGMIRTWKIIERVDCETERVEGAKRPGRHNRERPAARRSGHRALRIGAVVFARRRCSRATCSGRGRRCRPRSVSCHRAEHARARKNFECSPATTRICSVGVCNQNLTAGGRGEIRVSSWWEGVTQVPHPPQIPWSWWW